MKIVRAKDGIIEMRGYGYDEHALLLGVPKEDVAFDNYGLILLVENMEITRAQLNIYDRNISILYLSSH